ncbi:hypothetical protein E8L99_04755 [Phreatobacter aquaticus]|uniref:UPF0235 protein E8L99_04755 n=1 Tax=Phreatobacter aquaticus TaxID=2570229 RepID=A0A4D7QI96_9HYPH|nr:DUF167 family protein [Phreatobacter aquaticus]QCK85136.1 hypothetical protein E8L99_04755 [Phreatobacter aquaticus]
MTVPYRIDGDVLLLDIRLTPRGGRDAIEGAERLSDGRPVVKARVRAVPEDGKANAALEALVADAMGVAKSKVEVVQGQTARLKTVSVRGDASRLSATAARLFVLGLALVAMTALSTSASAQFVTRGDICTDPTEFLRSRAVVERAGLANPDRGRLLRTIRAAQSLAEEGCTNRDAWLVRRSVGMLNAVNREVRRPPVELPAFVRQ